MKRFVDRLGRALRAGFHSGSTLARGLPSPADIDRPTPTLESAPVCGRFTNTRSKSDEIQQRLVDRLGIEPPDEDRGYRRFNIAPTQEVLAVVENAEGRRMELLRWGLLPRWAKDPKIAHKMINARAETIAERPAYRGLVRHSRNRCLVLADGYYEWQKPEDPRQPRRPLHFALAGGDPFFFAGLWTCWQAPGSERLATCTIVTCEANELTRPIHDRMPVMLPDESSWSAWLDQGVDGDAARGMLVPLAAERMIATPASPLVNSARHDGADCLTELAA